MGDPRSWRTAVRDLEFMLPACAPEHEYIVHAAELPLPAYVKDLRFHGIVLGPTFLCSRYDPRLYERVRHEYDFIRESDAVKIALPQDDYDCSAVLDRWMIEWKIDAVYSPCPADTWPVLYPGCSAAGAVRGGFTGYVSETWIDAWRNLRPFESRSIDVSYRARKLPPNFGRIGHLKGVIGERFASHPATADLRLDISTDPKAVIPGAQWHAFLEDSRFCLATNSGSSLLDPEGQIRACVERYLVRHPDADFDEVEAHCFKGEDGKYAFTAISPRHLEAALAGTVQIATPGDYGGIFEAGTHYMRLEPDCSNAADVTDRMRDRSAVASIAKACKSAVLDHRELRSTYHASQMIQLIESVVSARRIQGSPADGMRRAIDRYQSDVGRQTDSFWKRHRTIERLRAGAVALGARRVKRFFTASTL